MCSESRLSTWGLINSTAGIFKGQIYTDAAVRCPVLPSGHVDCRAPAGDQKCILGVVLALGYLVQIASEMRPRRPACE